MTEQPTKSTEEQDADTALASALKQRWWKRCFDWAHSARVRVVLIIVGVLAGPPVLVKVAGLLGAPHELGVEMAKLIYSWPVVVGACIIVFITTFREPLSRILGGVRRFKAGAVEFDLEQQVALSSGKDPRKGEITWNDWIREFESKLSTVDRAVLEQLNQLGQQIFAHWRRRWWFEKVWGQIYATQVQFVASLLENSDDTGLTDAAHFFRQHLEKRGVQISDISDLHKNLDLQPQFIQWVTFLEYAHLIEVHKVTGKITATDLTKPFIEYIEGEHYTVQMRVL